MSRCRIFTRRRWKGRGPNRPILFQLARSGAPAPAGSYFKTGSEKGLSDGRATRSCHSQCLRPPSPHCRELGGCRGCPQSVCRPPCRKKENVKCKVRLHSFTGGVCVHLFPPAKYYAILEWLNHSTSPTRSKTTLIFLLWFSWCPRITWCQATTYKLTTFISFSCFLKLRTTREMFFFFYFLSFIISPSLSRKCKIA